MKETHGHVALATDVGFRKRLLELSGHSEVTELDLPFAVDKDVRGFYIWRIN